MGASGWRPCSDPCPFYAASDRLRQPFFDLVAQLKRTGLAQVFHAPIDVILDDTNVVDPDLVVVAKARCAIITHKIEGVPDIVVEILSPRTTERDRHLKKRLYARFGVPEYWIVDPVHGFVEAYRMNGNDYELRARYDRASTLRCPDFPDLAILLAPVFE
jgi:Uma2 family endonuclease